MQGEVGDKQFAINLVGILQSDHLKNDFQAGKGVELVGHQAGCLSKALDVEGVHIGQTTVVVFKSNHLTRSKENGLTGD